MMLALLLLPACWGLDPVHEEQRQDAIVPRMDRHDVQAGVIRQAIIDGDLEKAHQTAGALAARLPLPGLPTRLDSFQSKLRAVAVSIQGAADLHAAAGAFGELALGCGSCHSSVGIHAPAETDMPNGQAWEDVMARHRWASDEMWTSLVWAAPKRFADAVAVWNATPLVRPHTEDEKRFSSEALALEDRVHDLAARAADTKDDHERATLYGQMLETCASCHALVRRP